MNRGKFILMARKSGFLIDGVQEFVYAPSSFHFTEELIAFAALVREAERERIAKWYESDGYMMFPVAIPKTIRSGK